MKKGDKSMERISLIAGLALSLIASTALAAGNHAGAHGYSYGEPGKAADVTRTIKITATDDMLFVHEPLSIRQGETIRFVITNTGAKDHEFSLGDAASQRAHALMMKKMPDMKHDDDASAVHLSPGDVKEIIWKFSKPVQGNVEFACHLKGHYEAGMKSQVKMTRTTNPR
jgi:uncharacterized cupredoxin-like copper-binding protein